jgi:RNA polymerase sigma factor (sigma-70 family)
MTTGRQTAGEQLTDLAFRSFYDAHFAAIYRYFGRRLSSVADRNDLVSDVFLVAWRRREALPVSPHERTLWLYGVSRRVLADHRKAEFRRHRLAGRILATTDHQVPTYDPATFSETEAGARLAAALSHLGPRDQEVLALVAWEQLTHAEAAAVLGCSTNAFTIRFRRARQRLSARYEALEPGPSSSDAAGDTSPSGLEGASDA